MLFWHCTIRTWKKQDPLCVVKVKFHVFICYKKYEERTEQFFSGSHLRIDQFNFSPYSVKVARLDFFERGYLPSLSINYVAMSKNPEYANNWLLSQIAVRAERVNVTAHRAGCNTLIIILRGL